MADTVAAFVIERVMEWGVFRIYSHPGGGINGITAAQCKDGVEGHPRRATPAAQRRKFLEEDGYEGEIDTTLIPPGTQYGATHGKAEQRNRLRNAGFASLCNPLQRLSDHS